MIIKTKELKLREKMMTRLQVQIRTNLNPLIIYYLKTLVLTFQVNFYFLIDVNRITKSLKNIEKCESLVNKKITLRYKTCH